VTTLINHRFTTEFPNINSRVKLSGTREMDMTVRWRNVSKEKPLTALFTLFPKTAMDGAPEGMKPAEGADGKKSFTADFSATTDGQRRVTFPRKTLSSPPPDGLVVTRGWEKTGNTWGTSTIRIQSPARWNIAITLPNGKTNVNNLNIQPNSVTDGNTTFVWNNRHDLKAGITLKFPVEVGDLTEYHPKIRIERNMDNKLYPNRQLSGKEAVYDGKEWTLKMQSEQEYAYSYTFQGTISVVMNEMKK